MNWCHAKVFYQLADHVGTASIPTTSRCHMKINGKGSSQKRKPHGLRWLMRLAGDIKYGANQCPKSHSRHGDIFPHDYLGMVSIDNV